MALPQFSLQMFQNQLQSISLLLCASLILLVLLRRDKSKSKSSRLPPSPPKLPIIGNLHQIVGGQLQSSLRTLSLKYGPCMLLHLGGNPTVIISSAEVAKQIMTTHDMIFASRPTSKASKVIFGSRDVAFSPYGEYWRQLRKVCMLDLFSMKRVDQFKFIRTDETADMVKKIHEACEMKKSVNISELISTVTNNIISRITLGRKNDSEFAQLTKDVLFLLSAFSLEDMFPSLGWIDVVTGLNRRIHNTSRKINEFLYKVIEEHIEVGDVDNNDQRKDFVDILLDHQKNNTITMSKDDIISVLMDMFVAGANSIYTIVEWATVELIKHPEIMKRVQEDVRRVVGEKSTVDENDLPKMSYLVCVVKEALRLYSTAIIPRVSADSTEVGPFVLPAKITIMISTFAISRDPNIWDKPDEFNPDRFINNPIDYISTNFEFMPFGGGRRGCPATTYATRTVLCILSNLLCFFDWKLPSGINPKDLADTFDFNLHLKEPLHLLPLFPLPS